MSTPIIPKLVSKNNAQLIVDLDQEVINAILRLASLGLKPEGVVDYCQKVVDGETPAVASATGGAKPLTIQAYSFLSDKSICVDKYGMDLAEASDALRTLKRDPEKGRQIVFKAVSDHQLAKNSPKPITVSLAGLPTDRANSGSGGDGGKAELSELMRRNQAIAGQYKFDAEENGPDGPERFRVILGGNLAVVGQNKAVALKAAALVRVLGRRHQVLVKYVRLHVPNKPLAPSTKIPESVYNGVIAPDEVPPSASNGNSASTVG